MATWFITGCNRGIGLQLAKTVSARTDVRCVFVTVRGSASGALEAAIAASLGKIVPFVCDVTVPASLESAVALLQAQLGDSGGVDVLVNNVGSQSAPLSGIEALPDETLISLFDINVLSAHRASKALLPFLRKGRGKTIINLSTTLGSIGMARVNSVIPTPAYKIVKAALNMLTVQYALDLEKEHFTVVAISPGNLKTDLGGGENAALSVEEGVEALLDVIFAAKPEQSGQFLNIQVPGWESTDEVVRYDGGEIVW